MELEYHVLLSKIEKLETRIKALERNKDCEDCKEKKSLLGKPFMYYEPDADRHEYDVHMGGDEAFSVAGHQISVKTIGHICDCVNALEGVENPLAWVYDVRGLLEYFQHSDNPTTQAVRLMAKKLLAELDAVK